MRKRPGIRLGTEKKGKRELKMNIFQSFQWMSRVLQAVDSIHQVGIYCLALVPPNHLPKTPLGGIHLSETRKKFLEGSLHPANVLMCPHTCVTNLPKPREVHHGKQSPHSSPPHLVCVPSQPGFLLKWLSKVSLT